MDKNKILIDELFRQRLGGDEVPERSGAWLNMRDLLDREMPVQEKRRRKAAWLPYTTALLLLGTFALGGYQYLKPTDATQEGGTTGWNKTSKNGTATVSGAIASNQNLPSDHSVNTTATETSQVSGQRTSAKASNSHAAASNNGKRGHSENRATGLSTGNHTRVISGNQNGTSNSVITNAGNQPVFTASAAPTEGHGFNGGSESSTMTSVSTDAQGGVTGRSIKQIEKPQASGSRMLASANNAKRSANAVAGNPKESVNPSISTENTIAPQTGFSKPAGVLPQPADSSKFVLKKDTIEQIRIAYHYDIKNRNYQPDTQSVSRLVVDKWVLKELAQKALSATTAITVASTDDATTSDISLAASHSARGSKDLEQLVPLANFRTSSHKTGVTWDPQAKMQDIVREAKFHIAQTKFYGGIVAGLNSSAFSGATSLQGFHLGLMGMLAWNENWSLGAELKYFQRFNRGNNLYDNYGFTDVKPQESSTFTGNNGEQYKVYLWEHRANEHYFSFSTMSGLELPIYLRFSKGRFSLMGGANLTYNFATNVEEVTKHYAPQQHWDTVAVSQVNNYLSQYTENLANEPAKIRYEHFGSRFGMGYMLGAGFQVTPAVNIDLRLSKSMWDNYRTSVGSRMVSDAYYRVPFMQFTLGYRFNQQPVRQRDREE